jgi:sigma-B regulation protein RsbU (phosphoserine phosphatase)
MSGEEDPQKENELRLERLELALKASNEGIWDWWTDQREIFYSRRILEFLECGENRAPNLFLAPFERVHAEDQEAFERAVRVALQDGGPETLAVDVRVLTGGGKWLWLRIRGTVVRDRAGKALRIAGSMIDISRRKEAEAQVEEERFLLRNLIDHVPLQIYFKNPRSEIVMANQGLADWQGVPSPKDLLGKHDRDLFDEEHWRAAEQDEIRIMQTGLAITNKLEEETWREKEQTWVITSKFPWLDRNGNIKGTFGVSSDVTQLVKAQQQASALAEELRLRNQAYEEELHLAREIQQALAGGGSSEVLSVGDRAAARIDSRYIPISGLAGDFFEVIPVNGNAVGVLICDVMGHGVRSALVVAMLRGLLEKQRSSAGDPALFLKGLNDGLCAILERAGVTMFATAFYGVIDLSSLTLRHACAGHPGPILQRRDGVLQLGRERCEKGPGLGLIPQAVYPETTLDLSDAQRMILFTDGVLEAENQQGEGFFEERLMELIATHRDDSLGELLDGILASVLAFSESRQFDDDVCLLGVELVSGTK